MAKLKMVKSWKNWTAEDVLSKMEVEVKPEEREAVLRYIETNLGAILDSVEADAKASDNTPENYIIGSFENAYNDGDIPMEDPEEDGEENPDQELIEVSQTEVKKALKTLLSKQNDILSTMYLKHDEYNKEFFYGRLSVPLITIDKLSNKTLGNYTAGTDTTGLENHIRFNRNFIALNTETRILETLRHEMIHQYQDEVLYEKKDKEGNIVRSGAKRPREWHNKEFKEWADRVGIPCIGRHGGGNPAKMPEPKSYNRKFRCGCIATNGYPLTVWSTRPIFALCQVCGEEFTEVPKAGKVIAVSLSDIEKNGQDAVELRQRETYSNFDKFEDKAELTAKVKELKEVKAEYKEGIYQRGHNSYAKGYHYWVAWNEPKEEEQPKPKRGRKAGSKNKAKGENGNDKGIASEQTK